MDTWRQPGFFIAGGEGTIVTGEADFTTLQSNTLFTGITGTYTAGVDGRGTITFNNIAGTPTFAFSIDPGGSGHGRLIEFDGTGTRGSGRLEAQTQSTCLVGPTTTYIGNFAFGGTGFTSSVGPSGAGPLAFAGAITATPPIPPTTVGSLGPGKWTKTFRDQCRWGAREAIRFQAATSLALITLTAYSK